jgi:dTDP-glucose pyrophosphorylase
MPRVIVLAAGQSKRFAAVGITTPKQFLNIDWRGRVDLMVNHVLRSIPMVFDDIVVAVATDEYAHLLEKSYSYNNRIRYLEVGETKGPAHTVSIVLEHNPENKSTLIMDSDVLNYTNDLWNLCDKPCSGVLVHPSANPESSYVNKIGFFDDIMEKNRISEWAVRGAYFIHESHMSEFKRLLGIFMPEYNEPFISHVMTMMLDEDRYALECTYAPVDWGDPRMLKASGARIIHNEETAHARNQS